MDDVVFFGCDTTLVIELKNGKSIRFKPPCDNCDETDCSAMIEMRDVGNKYEIVGWCSPDGYDSNMGFDSWTSGTFKKSIVTGYYEES